MQRDRAIAYWLWVGVVMVFVQIILGGITRLTGSGLSITKWEIVTGTIPPLNQTDWQEEFDLYKETPQYEKINTGMTLAEFKFIYFWEYIHRLWARLIGFVFLIPFLLFAFTGRLSRDLYRNLGIAVLLGGIVAAFGWIMVASGLIDRPWVNAYKLTVHLNLALVLYVWLTWIAIEEGEIIRSKPVKRYLNLFTLLLGVQLLLGGLMSGLKACLYYPTWPDMHGEFFPKILIDSNLWTLNNIIEYEKGLVPGIVQFLHRTVAYFIFVTSLIILWKSRKNIFIINVNKAILVLVLLVILQICLGILTVINCVGSIPLIYGVVHQATAILILTSITYLHRKIRW